MVNIGRPNKLKVIKKVDAGVYLSGDAYGQILLPRRYVPPDAEVGSELDVFVYWDSENRLAATTETPLAMVGEFAWLKVLSIDNVGAFLDWGLAKDLLLPYSEHKYQPEVGKRVMVYLFLDDQTERIAATTRIEKFLSEEATNFTEGQEVSLLITDNTELGYKAIVDNSHWGVLYSNELFENLSKGQYLRGYIKKIRADKKIDLTLYQHGHEKIAELSEQIVRKLIEHDGVLMLTDKSPPESIYSIFKVSKKAYKKAVGILYKQRRIVIEPGCVRLVETD
ncbi:MAG: putative RNA-binding protein (virulence factor B family) [Gammaproteobacteria bacterium]|jgi:predicted RNA-binding protein (virulence factor B family)